MIRTILRGAVLVSAFSLVGCSSGGGVWPFSESHGDQAQLAAYAANASYPSNAKADDSWHAGAVVDQSHSVIHVYNYSDRPLSDVNVWVDGNYVTHVMSIPPKGSVTLHESEFYDHQGDQLSKEKTTPVKVEVQQGDRLFSLEGPVIE